MSTDAALRRLATLVAERRTALRLSKDRAAAVAGISRITWRKVEEGRLVRDTSYAAVEEALGWAAGSAAAILSGGEPTLIEDNEDSSGPDPDLVASAANVLSLVLKQFGAEVYMRAVSVVERENALTDGERTRRA